MTPHMATTCEPAPLEKCICCRKLKLESRFSLGCSSTYTASLTSSIINYQYENGRRYHAYPNAKEVSSFLFAPVHVRKLTQGSQLPTER